jgi:hypothetical protein
MSATTVFPVAARVSSRAMGRRQFFWSSTCLRTVPSVAAVFVGDTAGITASSIAWIARRHASVGLPSRPYSSSHAFARRAPAFPELRMTESVASCTPAGTRRSKLVRPARLPARHAELLRSRIPGKGSTTTADCRALVSKAAAVHSARLEHAIPDDRCRRRPMRRSRRCA